MRKFSKVFSLIGLVLMVGFGFVSASFAEMSKWKLDHDHSGVGFQVAHMVVSKTNGKFTEYSGIVEMDADEKELKPSKRSSKPPRSRPTIRNGMSIYGAQTFLMSRSFRP